MKVTWQKLLGEPQRFYKKIYQVVIVTADFDDEVSKDMLVYTVATADPSPAIGHMREISREEMTLGQVEQYAVDHGCPERWWEDGLPGKAG